ncbi:hypothetical protein [Micromonospora sp. WMMD812]|uniref:hypothetical protein n=1 Tax=Micromonospora sp. WMMD812 TaxID=3015152 RepID=UPI00248BE540|nr:hypothetical protein [Micromonospora sp. WMMD812]WBB66642.1 hypothetical protein O7603_26390 [Micromonospora sp. WMMD812]
MDVTGTRGRYGQSLAVATGWYATAVAALAVGTLSVPNAPPQDCSAIFSCLSPGETLAVVALVWGAPVFVALMIVTAVVTALVARRVASAIVAGTLSAAVAVAVCAVAAAAIGGRL